MRATSVATLATALLMAMAAAALAHPLAPALLELRELDGNRIEVLWKTSLLRAPGAEVAPVLPDGCRTDAVPARTSDGDSLTATWTMTCASGLVGQRVGVAGLADARIDALVRITLADGRVIRSVVRAAAPVLTVPARERRADIVAAYVRIGIEHILGGIDHLLFIVGLLMLVRGWRQLLETMTAFTVGYSVTLSLAALDLIRSPTAPIELGIALSVFALAVELARDPHAPPSLLRRRPWAMAFAFALLHGLGLASALRELALPSGEASLAVVSFNVGIEIGLLAFVATMLTAAAAARRLQVVWPRWMLRVPLYTIGSLAAFWCFERAAALVR